MAARTRQVRIRLEVGRQRARCHAATAHRRRERDAGAYREGTRPALRRPTGPGHLFEQVDQRRGVGLPAGVAQLDGVQARHPSHRPGELMLRRQHAPVDEHRNDRHPGREGALDLATNPVIGTVDAPPGGPRSHPIRPDHGQHHIRALDLALRHGDEVSRGTDIADVHEHRMPELLPQCVVQAPGVASGVISPIADEDPHRALRRSCRLSVNRRGIPVRIRPLRRARSAPPRRRSARSSA